MIFKYPISVENFSNVSCVSQFFIHAVRKAKARPINKEEGGRKKKVIEKFAVLISTCRRIELLFGRNKGIPNNFASRSDTFNREIFSCPGAKGVLRFHKITCALDLFSRSSQRCLAPRSLPVTNKRSLRC